MMRSNSQPDELEQPRNGSLRNKIKLKIVVIIVLLSVYFRINDSEQWIEGNKTSINNAYYNTSQDYGLEESQTTNMDMDQPSQPVHPTDAAFLELAEIGMPWRSPDKWNNTQSVYPNILKEATTPTSFEILKGILDRNENQTWSNLTKLPSCMIPNHAQTDRIVDSVIRGGERMQLPILNMGMPKEGSTTLTGFFNCAGLKTSHWRCGSKFCGPLMKARAEAGENPINVTSTQQEAMMQMDYPGRNPCVFPQIQLLDEIHRDNPQATFILIFRPVKDWIASVKAWSDMRFRLKMCDLPGFPKWIGDKDEDMMAWHCAHVKHIREFVAYHPSHNLIELDLYDNDRNARVMSTIFHSNSECWSPKNVNKKPHF